MTKRLDLAGQKFARLLVTKFAYVKNQKTYWHCLCDCGQETVVCGKSLKLGHVQSCGCLRAERTKEALSKHNDCDSRLYEIWKSMRKRVYNKKDKSYPNYGGRGISICSDWGEYSTFKSWALSNGYNDALTIERIDVDGNYEPANCCWITKSEQSKNRRNVISYNGMASKDLAARLGITAKAFCRRLQRGLTIDEAVSTPPRYKRNRAKASG